MIRGAPVYKNTTGQIVGKTENGFVVKTGDTTLKITEYTYAGKIKIGDRLVSHE